MEYVHRLVEGVIEARLGAVGAVVLEGPRAVGKTETGRFLSKSEILLDVDPQAASAMEVAPDLLLRGETPRLIDEWQVYPTIWNHIRREVDRRGEPGQFLLTGSAVPDDDITRHSGAGRLVRVRLRPMTLVESGDSSGLVSLSHLIAEGSLEPAQSEMSVDRLAELVARGGWPVNLTRTTDQALIQNRGYLEEISRADISRVDGVRRDPNNVGRLLRSLARNSATTASRATLARDTAGVRNALDVDTVSSYLDAVERLMILETLPAWSTHLRSKATLRKAPKLHFVDPSLAVAALDATPDRLVQDLNTLGLLFESLVVRDLHVFAELKSARLFHYRDSYGLEADAIVEDRAGRWAAIEVKLGAGQVDGAAASLLRLAETVDTEQVGDPSALIVVTGSGLAFRRPDGVAVVPIGLLGP